MHHTKEKGDLGVLKAQVDLHQQGFMILTPHTEHAAFDLVAYRGGEFKRIQVKYRKVVRGAISITFSTTWADKSGTHSSVYDKGEVDLFCIYCPDTNECYYVDPKQFDGSVTLRVEAPKNKQVVGVNLASEFRRVP